MKMIKLDKMTMEDTAHIALLDKECFAIPWSEDSFRAEMENVFATYIVAKDEDKCIGYCGFWQAYDEGDITNVAVDTDYRRQHIGSRLIEEMIRRAKNMKLELLTLEVRRSNIAAQGLYEKYGFEVIGERKAYYSDNREDALIMTKML